MLISTREALQLKIMSDKGLYLYDFESYKEEVEPYTEYLLHRAKQRLSNVVDYLEFLNTRDIFFAHDLDKAGISAKIRGIDTRICSLNLILTDNSIDDNQGKVSLVDKDMRNLNMDDLTFSTSREKLEVQGLFKKHYLIYNREHYLGHPVNLDISVTLRDLIEESLKFLNKWLAVEKMQLSMTEEKLLAKYSYSSEDKIYVLNQFNTYSNADFETALEGVVKSLQLKKHKHYFIKLLNLFHFYSSNGLSLTNWYKIIESELQVVTLKTE